MKNNDIKLSEFPEEITEDGLRLYGETSYENQMAVLSHYLHNNSEEVTDEKKKEIILAIREFLSRKQFRQGKDKVGLSDEELWMAAESPLEYNLFKDFFDVPFPAPEHPKFTFIDLFAGIGGFRIAFQNLGGKCVYSSEFDAKAQESYLANMVKCHSETSQRNPQKVTSPKNSIYCVVASLAKPSHLLDIA